MSVDLDLRRSTMWMHFVEITDGDCPVQVASGVVVEDRSHAEYAVMSLHLQARTVQELRMDNLTEVVELALKTMMHPRSMFSQRP